MPNYKWRITLRSMRYNNIRKFSVKIYNNEIKIIRLFDEHMGIDPARVPSLATFGRGTYALKIPLMRGERIVDVCCIVESAYHNVVARLKKTHGHPGLLELTLSDQFGNLRPAQRIGAVVLGFNVDVTYDRPYDKSRYATR